MSTPAIGLHAADDPAETLEKPLTAKEIQQIIQCNQMLTRLEVQMLPLFESEAERMAVLTQGEQEIPWSSAGKHALLSFTLREDDPASDPEDDNILTEREVYLDQRIEFWADGEDHSTSLSELIHYNLPPVCWLFHELYDHDYGPGFRRLSLRDIGRIGNVYVDVVTTDQFEVALN